MRIRCPPVRFGVGRTHGSLAALIQQLHRKSPIARSADDFIAPRLAPRQCCDKRPVQDRANLAESRRATP